MKQLAILILPIALASCGGDLPANQANAAAPAAKAGANAAAPAGNTAAESTDEVLRTETVTGTFTGWEMGDYLWANFTVPGRDPIAAQPGPSPIDLFLDAHRGRQVTVEIATLRTDIPEAGGTAEIQRVAAARTAATDAESWWRGLPEAERAAARRRFEEGALSGR
jgi:hypothetical protein